jgi:hypothetical protein
MLRKFLTSTAAAAAFVTAGAALADPLVGTGAVSVIGVASSTATIGIGTTFTNSLSSVIGSATGDLAAAIGIFYVTDPITASIASPVSFTAAFGSFVGSVALVSAAGPVDSRVVDVYAVGIFTPAGVLGAFTPGLMSLTASFTQTGGPESAVSGSYTLASPPAPPRIAEPATLALLGAGLLGLAAVRRRKA